MYRYIIILIILCSAFQSKAQDITFKELDSTTYKMFTDERWDELIEYSESLPNEDVDYYYHNVRMGIAYYNTRQYYSAEEYLVKAIKNYDNDFPKKHLIWIYQWLGESFRAEQLYGNLTQEGKKEVDLDKKAIEYIYLEGGLKSFSTDNPNMYYGNISLGHRIFGSGKLHHSYKTYSQTMDDTKFKHNQYDFKLQIPTNKFTIGIGGVYGKSSDKIKYFGNSEYSTYHELTTSGFNIDYSKRIKRFSLNLQLNYLHNSADSISMVFTFPQPGFPPMQPYEVKETFTSSTIIPSLTMYYTPKILNDRLTLGIDNYLVYSDNQTFLTFKPQLIYSISEKLRMNLNYINIGNYAFQEKETGILYNDTKYSTKKLSGTLSYYVSPKTTFSFTYSNELVNNSVANTDTKVNNFYLGINFNF